MIAYKIESKGGLVLILPTKQIKPGGFWHRFSRGTCPEASAQRCPNCGTVHKEWADLSNRYPPPSPPGRGVGVGADLKSPAIRATHTLRERSSVMVMYNVAIDRQPGLGTRLADCGCFSSTDSTSKRKHTGSMKQRRTDEASKIQP